MQKTSTILISVLSTLLLLSSCGNTSVVESGQDNLNLSLNTFEAYRSNDENIQCSGYGSSFQEVGVGWYSLGRGIGDGMPSFKGIGDGMPSRYSAQRGIGDGMPSRKGIGDGMPSRSYSDSLMFVADSGEVKSKHEIVCANFVASMQVAVDSNADSLLVSIAEKTVSVSVIDGMAQIDIALEDLQETEVRVQDVNSGEVMHVIFAGIE